MKWLKIISITAIVFTPAFFMMLKMKQSPNNEKVTFALLTALGWILAILLVLFPELPGPTQVINKIYKPLGKILE